MASANQELNELKEEMKALAATVQESVKHAARNGASDAIGFGREEISRFAHDAGQNVRHFFRAKKDQASAVCHETEAMISRRPLTSVALAVTAGLVLGALLHRR